ncbi:STAS/SEC14 domain-containing protein [Alteromonas halophila]|uniref:STAS/SEC14 domain-containing protein n=1 Tax=Alteromonas halophila TaxID=516698 RepID=A0A918JHA5_9ALTE|nr:STAS/SEC14 domain-containing protein [Alteromonas halophila]GGW79559.1 STAS/SEC14 domain-containing protein [Alteromonas halophila]
MQRHGLTIGIERTDEQFFLTMKATGKLTHEDYAAITPLIDGALAEVKGPKVRIFIDATEFEGWEPRAAWDDFKLGLKHGREFEKVAIYGTRYWQELVARIGNWFISGEARYFEDIKTAMSWLND